MPSSTVQQWSKDVGFHNQPGEYANCPAINPTPISYTVNQALPFHLGSDNCTKMKRQRELIYTDNNANDDHLACESTMLKVRIIILEIIDDSFGLYLWPSSFVLAQFIWHLRHSHVQHQRILELGAGVALPGFLAAKLGAKEVILTDRSDSHQTLRNCREARDLNHFDTSQVSVVPLDWGHFTHEMIQCCSDIDLVLGSDCLYNSEDFEDLFATIDYIFDQSPHCHFYTTYHLRSSNRSIACLLEKWHMDATEIPWHDLFSIDESISGSAPLSSVYLFDIVRKIDQTV